MSHSRKVQTSTGNDEYGTPQEFFNKWDMRYNFTLDPCATPKMAKCDRFFTKKDNGLIQSWENCVVWCNPPYSKLKPWVMKARDESFNNGATVVMLIPARTGTSMFKICWTAKEIHFVEGRIRFVGAPDDAPFPCIVVVFDHEIHNKPEFFRTSRGFEQGVLEL